MVTEIATVCDQQELKFGIFISDFLIFDISPKLGKGKNPGKGHKTGCKIERKSSVDFTIGTMIINFVTVGRMEKILSYVSWGSCWCLYFRKETQTFNQRLFFP